MKKSEIKKALQEAEAACTRSGARLTDKRRDVLGVLLRSELPLSAYEVTDRLKEIRADAMPPMSVYRMLDFLVAENLAHKLNSTGKYLACAHITCSHAHEEPQFLICDRCQKVKEANIGKGVIKGLKNSVASNGFELRNPQLELHCLCERCAA